MRARLSACVLLALLACAWGCGSTNTAAPTHDSGVPEGGGVDAGADAPPSCPVVQTAGGPVQGQASGGTCSYEGIPYAAPPIGPLRWKAPQPAAAWMSTRPSSPASGCPQLASTVGAASSDEDCLYLNVWTPSAASMSAPVMVFVHGGGFVWGSGSFPLYDGTKLATATGAVVITINYRLGPFGFLSNAALRAEDPAHPSAGNYGIEDQIAAFQWVKQNAAAFGGDAANVTIFGESAGGSSMFVHLVSAKSQGLFAHVVVESGWAPYGSGALTTTIADRGGGTLASALGCTDPAMLLMCLRGKSADAVLAAVPGKGGGLNMAPNSVDWLPVIDGFVLTDDPAKLFASGSFNKVPTLLGNNKNEGTLFVTPPLGAAPTSAAGFQAFEEAQFPGHGAAIVAQYPVASFGGSYTAAAAEALTDGVFVCPARRVARACAAAGVPTFRYDFTHAINFPVVPGLGAFHASELLFVFGNPLFGVSLQPSELPLSQEMMAYWGAMAAKGDPNGVSGQLAWPKYDATTETNIVLDLTLSTEAALKKAQCDFWDSFAP